MQLLASELNLIYKEYKDISNNNDRLSVNEAMQIMEELNKSNFVTKYKSPFNIDINEIYNKYDYSKITTLLSVIEIGNAPEIYSKSKKNTNSSSKFFWYHICNNKSTKCIFYKFPPVELRQLWLKVKKIKRLKDVVAIIENNEIFINENPLK